MIYKGTLTLYHLTNTATKGLMPNPVLVSYASEYYGMRMVGYNRFYAAKGVNQQIDVIARIWRNTDVRINDYVILDDGYQYRIDFVQHVLDEDGLEVTDLTLQRLETNYDLAEQTQNTV